MGCVVTGSEEVISSGMGLLWAWLISLSRSWCGRGWYLLAGADVGVAVFFCQGAGVGVADMGGRGGFKLLIGLKLA
jgi:hypothetical protein